MGQRHLFIPSQIFEDDNARGWNPAEQLRMYLARADTAEISSLNYPVGSLSMDGAQYACPYIPTLNEYHPSGHNLETPHHLQDRSGNSQNPFLQPSTSANFYPVHENYGHHASSSNSNGGPYGFENGFVDLTDFNERVHFKRKSPSVPVVCEGGRYPGIGISSDISMVPDTWQGKRSTHHIQAPCDYPSVIPTSGGNGVWIGGEGTNRNVRSRTALDLETNPAMTQLSDHMSTQPYIANQHMNVASSVDLLGPSFHGSTREWNQAHLYPSSNDSSALGQETNPFVTGSSNHGVLLESGGYNNDDMTRRNPVPQIVQGSSAHLVREDRSSHFQRSPPNFRASSSNLRMGHADSLLLLGPHRYPARDPRLSSATGGRRTSDRNVRTRLSGERNRSFSGDASFHDQLASEGLMIADRSGFRRPRNSFDQHRDMRLDIDDMSYEELLALGERIGCVNTGLSDDMISKCLRESIHCSSDQIQEEGICMICLEQYENMDDVGMLRACKHDFHVGCIRRWLSLKNVCPICKASATGDGMKRK